MGGDEKGSLRPAEKCKLLVHQSGETLSRSRVANWQSLTLDAVQWLFTRLSPRTRIHAISTNVRVLRDDLKVEFHRIHKDPWKREELYDLIASFGDNEDSTQLSKHMHTQPQRQKIAGPRTAQLQIKTERAVSKSIAKP